MARLIGWLEHRRTSQGFLGPGGQAESTTAGIIVFRSRKSNTRVNIFFRSGLIPREKPLWATDSYSACHHATPSTRLAPLNRQTTATTQREPHRHKPFFLPPSEPGGQSSRSRRGVHGERHVSTAATAANPPVALPSLDAQSGPEGGKKGPPAWTVWLDSARAGRSFSDLLPSEGTCHSISPPLSRIETAAVLPDRSSAVTSKIESPSRHQKMLSKGRGLSEIPA
jgi:hypothetical protein